MDRLTPKVIGNNTYSIPIYQRLFEWDDERIIQLLDDLKEADKKRPYHIGMLTATNSSTDSIELVDGQQRFTIMMLMGIVLRKYYNDWNRFIRFNGHSRLLFTARPEDQEYLEALMNNDVNKPEEMPDFPYENKMMKRGIQCISKYMNSNFNEKERESFAAYAYSSLTFFVALLPLNYKKGSLNKYFERMNSAGKNLEGHEIIKVKLLQRIKGNKELFTKAWNRTAEMDASFFQVRKGKNESESVTELKDRIKDVLKNRNSIEYLFIKESPKIDGLNGLSVDSSETSTPIKSIEPSSKVPSKDHRTTSGSHSVVNFSDFLLLCLYTFLKKRGTDVSEITSFFNKANLVSTFDHYLIAPEKSKENSEVIDEFMKCLVKYRILLDVYFIRITDNLGDYDYTLETPYEGSDGIRNLKMFEEMLFVSSSIKTFYQWFTPLMEYTDVDTPVSPANLYSRLKENDDIRHPVTNLTDDSLSYEKVDRYWFWRLDFVIWQKRRDLFSLKEGEDNPTLFHDAIKVAEKYVFKRNRSIEHIAPQTPQKEDATDIKDKTLDSFGNLVMISSEQNSSLSNSQYLEKQARVKEHLNQSRSGSIESLKMLHAFTFNDTWNKELAEKHGKLMIELLKSSYHND